ncbi:hypothetical protein GJAV_G00264510 [Gymnothorax javanicus]|nr:hypothetical protein GJAV_G00264510 [Gymnothorax javanicus]
MNERKSLSHLTSVSVSDGSEVIQVAKVSQNKLKANKLSRSLRQTQKSPSIDSSYNYLKEFKTPKRQARVRSCASHNADSPSNDSDLQQDIIWDPTSPTAVWNGKGVKKSTTNVRAVDISEIVNRIAPQQNERPVIPESSLLQWIGDSAVPCTPDIPQPRTRKKSTRQSDVEDLMKLAKQFDFNMHQQDRAQVEEVYDGLVEEEDGEKELRSLENSPPPLPTGAVTSGRVPASQTRKCSAPLPADRRTLDQNVTDDFDALFDEPTQRISGRLSQPSSSLSQEGRAPPGAVSRKDALCGNGRDFGPGTLPSVSSAAVKKPEGGAPSSSAHFVDDDWDNDDLLNDSIVMEMTQNLDLFAPPKHCSTQIGPSAKQTDSTQKVSAGIGSPGQSLKENGGNSRNGLCQGKNLKAKNRSTFRLETNPNFHVKETLSGDRPSSSHGLESIKPGSEGALQSRPKGQLQPHNPKLLEPSHGHSLKTQTVPSVQPAIVQQSSSTVISSHVEEPVDAMNDDLDSIFASDSLWDDGDDDDLLCQVCEDVEKLSQSQASEPASGCPNVPATGGPKTTTPSVAVRGVGPQGAYPGNQLNQGHASGRTHCNFSRSVSVPGTGIGHTRTAPAIPPADPSSGSVVRDNIVSVANCAQSSVSNPQGYSGNWKSAPYRFTQLKKTPATEAGNFGATAPSWRLENASTASSAKNPGGPPQSSFKRHLSDPVALTNKVFVANHVPVRCSEAEIERKKQEALARRRLRMQTSQKHGGPT